jgi:uncharacterized protein YjbJ (UPF0337 family)
VLARPPAVQFEQHPGTASPTHIAKENRMADGSMDETKGRTKEALGDLTGDQDLKDEGKVDRASGKVKDAVGGASDKVKDAVNPDRKP